MNNKPIRYVGNPGFHDGFIRSVSQTDDKVLVSLAGPTGKRYAVRLDGVSTVESHSPQGMMLYALSEQDIDVESLRCYDFINWHLDQKEERKSKSHLRIVASGFTVTKSD